MEPALDVLNRAAIPDIAAPILRSYLAGIAPDQLDRQGPGELI